MSYNLSLLRPDEVTIRGTLGTDNAPASIVFHGIMTAGAGTSAALLTQMLAEWGPGAGTPISLLSANWTTKDIKIRQINGWKYRYGTAARFVLTVVGGVITGAAIGNPGGGYKPSTVLTADIIEMSALGAGSGALVNVQTNASGQVFNITVLAGGSGYTNPVVDLEEPNPPPGKTNPQRVVYGPADSIDAAGIVGAVAGDSAPAFNAFSIQLNTAGSGRTGKGHSHWPAVPEASTLQDGYQAGIQAALQTAANTWFVVPFQVPNPSANLWRPGVLSRKGLFEGDAFPNNLNFPTIFNVCTSVKANPNIGSVVRRKRPN